MYCVFIKHFCKNVYVKRYQIKQIDVKLEVKMSNRRSLLGSTLDALPAPTDPLRELFEACKTGDAARVKKLITPQTVNARDTAGRKSTPLHFAAGIYQENFR